jgi:hypothetical protein
MIFSASHDGEAGCCSDFQWCEAGPRRRMQVSVERRPLRWFQAGKESNSAVEYSLVSYILHPALNPHSLTPHAQRDHCTRHCPSSRIPRRTPSHILFALLDGCCTPTAYNSCSEFLLTGAWTPRAGGHGMRRRAPFQGVSPLWAGSSVWPLRAQPGVPVARTLRARRVTPP